jgi:formyl-CoA transferase
VPHVPASSALGRFTVLDLTQVRSGPTAVRQLADWGANVVKIEIPGADRALGGPRHEPDFQNLHRNKRAMTLDLKAPGGRDVLMRLAGRADVVVENFRPAVKERLGIDYESLRAVNPGIVLASISGFGQSGPYRDRPGFDQIAQGMGGLMSITGEPGRGPMRAGIPVADLCAGIFCAQAILVALLEREASGEGQWVHTSLLEAQVFMLDFQSARWLQDGVVPGQAGNDHPTTIPTGVFETADGHVNISVAGEPMWRAFCETIGAPALADDPDYATLADRSRNRAALNRAIDERTRTASSDEWVARLNAAGVPCGPIYSIDELFEDPQVRALAMVETLDSPALGPLRMTGQPFTLSRTDSRLATAPPERGEHTEEVLGEFGFTAQEIRRLREDGVI